MTRADSRIAAIATGQLGSFTRVQAYDAGLTDRQLRCRVQSGILQQIGPKVFRFLGAPLSLRSQLVSVVLDIGDPVWVAGPTAAALHGFDGFTLRAPFHLLVPRVRSLRRMNARIHRSLTIDRIDRAVVDGLPVTSPVRTIIDLARHETAEQLAAAIDSVLRDGGGSEDLLHRRVVALRTSGRFGIPRLVDVMNGEEVSRGGESWLERRYLELVRAAGLPRPDTQVVLTKAGDRLVRVDCRFPGTNVVVELLGYRFHRSRSQMSRDAARMNALLADGYAPYQFTYHHVVDEPHAVVDVTTRALTARRMI